MIFFFVQVLQVWTKNKLPGVIGCTGGGGGGVFFFWGVSRAGKKKRGGGGSGPGGGGGGALFNGQRFPGN